MADSILLNDGSSFLVLNDGTSTVLLNAHVGGGVGISGAHATQVTKKRSKITHVEFTFQLIASMLDLVVMKLLQLGKLHPFGIYNDKLRESFREQRKVITELKQRIKEGIVENTADDLLKDVFGDSYDKFKMYMELMKKLGR